MQQNEPGLLSEQVVSEIELLSNIARKNGTLISLKNIVELTSITVSEEELEKAWEAHLILSSNYELRQGLVVEKGQDTLPDNASLVRQYSRRKVLATNHIRVANQFLSLCKSKQTRLLAISGSTCYFSTSDEDDLDFFCVTGPDSLWPFLAKSLLLARIFRMIHPRSPRMCFSYAADELFIKNAFSLPSDALFARDALTTLVVHGSGFYTRLLQRSPWIANYFPKLHRRRAIQAPLDESVPDARGSGGKMFLNMLSFFLVGNYIKIKSAMLNRRLRKRKKFSAAFTVNAGLDHCVFESHRYEGLRDIYCNFNRLRSAKTSGELSPSKDRIVQR